MHRVRDVIALNLIWSLGSFFISAQQSPSAPLSVITDSTDIKSLTRADVDSLLHASAGHPLDPPTKQDKAAVGWGKSEEWSLKTCKGSEAKVGHTPARACGETAGSLHKLPIGIWYQFRACSLSYNDGHYEDYGLCTTLAKYLQEWGSTEAAKAVVETAPGCNSPDATGMLINRCVIQALTADLYSDDKAKLRQLSRTACEQYQQPFACQMLSNMGEAGNIQAAQQHQAETDQAHQEFIANQQEEYRSQNAANQAKADRLNATLGALQSLPGGGEGSIQRTASQQEANMRAVGDANAATKQNAASARIAAQQAAAAQQLAAQQAAAAQLAAQQQAAQQMATQTAPRSISPPGGGCSLVSYLVKASSDWRTGPAAMDHEVVASFTNNATFAVSCTLHFHKNGVWDSRNGSGFDLASGSTIAGEAGGLWTIGADSPVVQYVCYQQNATDTQGNTCSDLPW